MSHKHYLLLHRYMYMPLYPFWLKGPLETCELRSPSHEEKHPYVLG